MGFRWDIRMHLAFTFVVSILFILYFSSLLDSMWILFGLFLYSLYSSWLALAGFGAPIVAS